MYSFPSLETVFCSMSRSNCCFLSCIEMSQEAGQVVWYSHLFKNFPVCCDPNSQRLWCSHKTEVDVFLNYFFFDDSTDVGNLIPGSSSFYKSRWNIWKFKVHVLLSLAWRILSITLIAYELTAFVWLSAFWGIAFLWDWNEN